MENLGISEEVTFSQASYYIAYAERLERARSQIANGVDGDDDVWARIAMPVEGWLGPAVIASTLRLAAQHAALVDVRQAAVLAVRSGLAYLEAGLPFGMFALAGLLDDERLSRAMRRSRIRSHDDARENPVQLTYFLLAHASRPMLREYTNAKSADILRTLRSHSLHPIGPQGVPIADYLAFSESLSQHDTRDALSHNRPALLLAEMGELQARTLRAAMRSRYLWERGAAPVNIVDLEQVLMCGLLMMRSGKRPTVVHEEVAAELQGPDPLAELPVWAARKIEEALVDMRDEELGLEG
ncbi:hypothetical protein ACWEN6_16765 [Sphaerisporangium sp. NPDC004334]